MGEQVPYSAAEDLVIVDQENADPALILGVLVQPAISVPRPVRPMARRKEDRRGTWSATVSNTWQTILHVTICDRLTIYCN
jgi:hypothetical protein